MSEDDNSLTDSRLTRRRVAKQELVLRALHEPFWDAEKQRATPSAFGNGNCFSLSRPAVMSEQAIIARWREDLERPDRPLEALAEARVADILACSPPETAQSLRLNVFADPTDQNPAHAELVGSDQADTQLRKITRGVGNRILKQCRFRIV